MVKNFISLVIVILVSNISLAVDLNEDQVRLAKEVFGSTMSPFCPGRLLSDCPSSSATELKDNIRSKIASGESRENIDAYLESVYGAGIHATPPASGFGLVAWLMPAFFIFTGLLIFKFWLKKTVHIGSFAAAAPANPESSKWDKEIDKALKD
jgi:cytochrome c-type biogenesis protein CcmH/NrfF